MIARLVQRLAKPTLLLYWLYTPNTPDYAVYSYLLRRRQDILCDMASSSFKIRHKIDNAKRHTNARTLRELVDMPTFP